MYNILTETFSSKDALRGKVKAILEKYSLGEHLNSYDSEFMMAVFEMHPRFEIKKGSGIISVYVGRGAYNSKCFYLKRTDNSVIDISFRECFNSSTKRAKFMSACRTAVFGQIAAFRNQAFKDSKFIKCPFSGEMLTKENCHIDHVSPNTFSAIVDSFLLRYDLKIETIKVNSKSNALSFSDFFEDQRIIDLFAAHHKANAVLRVVSKNANFTVCQKVNAFNFLTDTSGGHKFEQSSLFR
jgi:pantothenate kinase